MTRHKYPGWNGVVDLERDPDAPPMRGKVACDEDRDGWHPLHASWDRLCDTMRRWTGSN